MPFIDSKVSVKVTEEQEKELERERLMGLSEKELLVEILIKLEEIKDNQFFYSD